MDNKDNRNAEAQSAPRINMYIPSALNQAKAINRDPATPIDFERLSDHLAYASVEILGEAEKQRQAEKQQSAARIEALELALAATNGQVEDLKKASRKRKRTKKVS